MQDVLGYKKFAAEGGDWGAIITTQLGHKYADRLIGAYMHLMVPLDVFVGGLPPASDYGPDEQGWYERNQLFFTAESGYSALQTTKPQTITHALNDTPAGLCSWILEKRRTWSDRDGNVEKQFTKEVGFLVMLMLTSATGLLLLVLRATPLMGVLLALHLGVVFGLFLSFPYGKFVHGFYRYAALVRFAQELRGPVVAPLERGARGWFLLPSVQGYALFRQQFLQCGKPTLVVAGK